MKSLPTSTQQQSFSDGAPAHPADLGGRLASRLASRRASLGLSREELGRRCGTDGHYIAALEDRTASPAAPTLVRLADALGVTVDDLTGELTGELTGGLTGAPEKQ
ncbi:helix-turn-helix domain-containing protein [Streptomyces cavernicola]|uniref:Helix-turn-helix transcriptional regulator n=1 Tax=Streptomyces cavernicola TaxID=3043613 RepID=A0ABT6SFX4_9ACTN|nr:helix-turn-helix transcriptional regulator [Streptomyces sp. B-S-A6]MDI3406875.1 helix-turn-helix transcriptional regulator [Streptomyces sp. B-S-A6]